MRDSNGVEVQYWPIPALTVGEDSETVVFNFDTPVTNGRLKSGFDARIKVWARVAGIGSYVDISTGDGIALSALSGPDTDFEVYVEALSTIDALDRILLSLTTGESAPAGWLA